MSDRRGGRRGLRPTDGRASDPLAPLPRRVPLSPRARRRAGRLPRRQLARPAAANGAGPYVQEVLDDWARLRRRGPLPRASTRGCPTTSCLTAQTARLVGALPHEVVVMNTLTVNLHLMMVSFYRPTRERHRILIEAGAFPSDQYAVASQARFHGFDPDEAVVRARRRARARSTLRDRGHPRGHRAPRASELALVLLGNVNYLTGQAFDMAAITRAGARAGLHASASTSRTARATSRCQLHDDGPDFAVWCTYKYLNGGPGALGGVFVHERHARAPRAAALRGLVGPRQGSRASRWGRDFEPMPGAEGWQLSNPPILSAGGAARLAGALRRGDDGRAAPEERAAHRLPGVPADRGLPGVRRSSRRRDPASAGPSCRCASARQPRAWCSGCDGGRGLRLPRAGHHPRRARAALHSASSTWSASRRCSRAMSTGLTRRCIVGAGPGRLAARDVPRPARATRWRCSSAARTCAARRSRAGPLHQPRHLRARPARAARRWGSSRRCCATPSPCAGG